MSSLLDLAVFPGNQGGPLMHIIAAKAVALEKLLQMSFVLMRYNYKKNANAIAESFIKEIMI
jgi:glycine hydroxymethyltransferase